VAGKILYYAEQKLLDEENDNEEILAYLDDMVSDDLPNISVNSICTQYDDSVMPGFYPDSTLDGMVNELIENIKRKLNQ
jgi:hypothetical protein